MNLSLVHNFSSINQKPSGISEICDSSLIRSSENTKILWNSSWGSPTNTDYGLDLILDSTGNITIAGYTESYGAEAQDVVVLKYNTNGTLLWNTTWGGPDYDVARGIGALSTGESIVCGNTESYGAGHNDFFLLKIDTNGILIWNTTWGGAEYDWAYALTIDTLGNIYVAGSTNGSGAGNRDFALVKFNSAGVEVWNTTWGGIESDQAYDIELDKDGNIYLVGHTYSFGAGNGDFTLLKYDPSGTLLWNVTWGGPSYDWANHFALDSSGNILCTGDTYSFGIAGDVAIVKFDPNGNKLWNTTWGTNALQSGKGIVIGSDGYFYITGRSHASGSADFFWVKFNSDGLEMWNESWGGPLNDFGQQIIIDSDANLYITGIINADSGYSNSNIVLLKIKDLTVSETNPIPAFGLFFALIGLLVIPMILILYQLKNQYKSPKAI